MVTPFAALAKLAKAVADKAGIPSIPGGGAISRLPPLLVAVPFVAGAPFVNSGMSARGLG